VALRSRSSRTRRTERDTCDSRAACVCECVCVRLKRPRLFCRARMSKPKPTIQQRVEWLVMDDPRKPPPPGPESHRPAGTAWTVDDAIAVLLGYARIQGMTFPRDSRRLEHCIDNMRCGHRTKQHTVTLNSGKEMHVDEWCVFEDEIRSFDKKQHKRCNYLRYVTALDIKTVMNAIKCGEDACNKTRDDLELQKLHPRVKFEHGTEDAEIVHRELYEEQKRLYRHLFHLKVRERHLKDHGVLETASDDQTELVPPSATPAPPESEARKRWRVWMRRVLKNERECALMTAEHMRERLKREAVRREADAAATAREEARAAAARGACAGQQRVAYASAGPSTPPFDPGSAAKREAEKSASLERMRTFQKEQRERQRLEDERLKKQHEMLEVGYRIMESNDW